MFKFALLLTTLPASAQLLTPVWVEGAENGKFLARVVVSQASDCPTLRAGAASTQMTLRQPLPPGLRPVCEAAIPARARSASVNGRPLALAKSYPKHIVAIGDTGCRIKGARVQDCNDPAKWPFVTIARLAAESKPDLVLHVGDYLYREDACPDGLGKLCGGTPNGDRWETWNADFFQPAAKLLAAAPWVFSRGNHEDCTRSWRGWFYYLDPRPFPSACQSFSAPYVVKLGKFEIAVLDTSTANDSIADPAQVKTFATQLASLHLTNGWLIDHHPFWGLRTDGNAPKPVPLTAPLEAAWEQVNPKGISLVISGHTHLFEIIGFDRGRPPQIVAGDAGTDMAPEIKASVNGVMVRGLTVASGQTKHEFGYTELRKNGGGWNVQLKGPAGGTLVTCRIEGERVIFPK